MGQTDGQTDRHQTDAFTAMDVASVTVSGHERLV